MQANDVALIIRLARLYGAAQGYSLSTVSLRIAGQGSLFGRLEGGNADLTIGRRDRILQKFSDHWPEGADWPADIPRPAPSPERENAA